MLVFCVLLSDLMTIKAFSKQLLAWYQVYHRKLPWRETNNAYFIWVSEIILQQTRVEQGLGYYKRFLSHFPDVQSLADASEDEVLHVWQGLGYYSRARNMQFAARQVVHDFQGMIPETYEGLMRLKGVGSYTAAAIASIAFGVPCAVLDGNVYRFLARYFGIADATDTSKGKTVFETLANKILPKAEPGAFNQAMMEFGALVCTPLKPACETCIFLSTCYAYKHDLVQQLPVKIKKVQVRKRFLNFLVYQDANGMTILEKRTGKDIWHGLYQFPLIESATDDFELEATHHQVFVSAPQIHQLTHQTLIARFGHIYTEKLPEKQNTVVLSIEQLKEFPLPRLISRYIETHSELFPGY